MSLDIKFLHYMMNVVQDDESKFKSLSPVDDRDDFDIIIDEIMSIIKDFIRIINIFRR